MTYKDNSAKLYKELFYNDIDRKYLDKVEASHETQSDKNSNEAPESAEMENT